MPHPKEPKRRPTDRVTIRYTAGRTAIPNTLLLDKNVSSNAIRLYGVIAAYAYPGQELRGLPQWALAGLCGFDSENTLTSARKELERLGYLIVERPKSRSTLAHSWANIYRITDPPAIEEA